MVGTAAPKVGVLALQGGFLEHEQALAACGANVARVRAVDDLTGLDGLLIPGGESTTISLLAQRSGMLKPIQELIANGLAVYGSCAGMIMLAAEVLDGRSDRPSFGGIDMSVRRNAFGRQVDSFESDLALLPLPGAPFPGVFIRAPWVERIGKQVEVVARLSESANTPDSETPGKIVAVRQGRRFATSFHPELTADRRIHQYFLDIVKGDA